MIFSINPASGEVLGEYPELTDTEVDSRLSLAAKSFRGRVGRAPIAERTERLRALSTVLKDRRESLARLASLEMGKPISQSRAEIDKSVSALNYYAEVADENMRESPRNGAYLRFEPLGPLLAIMPWNFPFWQVIRVLAPAITVGNPVLLKHAENVSGCAAAIESAVLAAGLPAGTLQVLPVGVPRIEKVIADERIQGVTFTGSVRVGRVVAKAAGARGKKTVLELGGSDPLIVCQDADVTAAADIAVRSRLLNSGQACIASKRFIVHRSLHQKFVEIVKNAFDVAIVGNPMDDATEIGPMARSDLRDTLIDQVKKLISDGARVVTREGISCGPGFFYPPTLLDGVKQRHASAIEETFGPVGSVIVVDSSDEAIRIANDTPFGLGASVCTRNIALALSIAERLEVGVVAINSAVVSRPDLPFGGVKASGYGRELGTEALREFTNVKTVLLPAE